MVSRLLLGLVCSAPACDAGPPAVGAAGAAASPLMALEPGTSAGYSGIVRAGLQAGGYSYLNVELAAGERRWAVSMGPMPDVGSAVRVQVLGTRTEFYSPRLGRTFATLDFAQIDAV